MFFNNIFTSFAEPYILEVYDNENYAPENKIYVSNSGKRNDQFSPLLKVLKLGGKNFYLKWFRSSEYTAKTDFLSTWIGLIGSLTVLLIAIFVINILWTQNKAQLLAADLNQQYIQSQSLIKIQEAKIAESSKMASLGGMASSIAHEINNPLAIISGKSNKIERVLLQSPGFPMKEQLLEDLSKINHTVQRISKIIKGLRLFARDGENDPMEIKKLGIIIEETLALCQTRFYNSGVELKKQLNYLEELECRETQISQVILNLLNNAFDAALVQEEKWIEIRTELRIDSVEIVIIDSGKGIPLKIQNKIFEPFFTTKTVGIGTGLGLSISKSIIESHDGKFSIDNNSINTKFVIIIPIKQSKSKKEPNLERAKAA